MKWAKVKLGDLFQIKHGWAFKGEYFSNEGELIIVTPGNFFEKGGFRQLAGKEKFYLGEFPNEFLLKKNDVIIAMTEQGPGLLGSPAIVPSDEKYLHNQRIGLIHEIKDDKIAPMYIYRLFFTSNVRNEIFGSATGTKVKHTAPKRIYDIYVNLPPLPTQHRISTILSAYDDLIENNLKRIKLLEEKLMIEYSLLEEDSKNLIELDFSDFVTFIKGIEPGSNNYLSEKLEGTIPFIRVGDLSKRDSDIFIEEEKSKGIICNPEDILVSMDGTIGIVKYGIYGCYSSGIRKAVSKGVLNNAFIFCYLTSKKVQGVIYSHSKGSTIQHAGSSINHFKIKLPKESSLNDFSRFSNSIYDLMNNLLKQNSKLREARDILLPKLMNGQIEV